MLRLPGPIRPLGYSGVATTAPAPGRAQSTVLVSKERRPSASLTSGPLPRQARDMSARAARKVAPWTLEARPGRPGVGVAPIRIRFGTKSHTPARQGGMQHACVLGLAGVNANPPKLTPRALSSLSGRAAVAVVAREELQLVVWACPRRGVYLSCRRAGDDVHTEQRGRND